MDFDCFKINIENLVGILLFERLVELKKAEKKQIREVYEHIRYCELCYIEYNEFVHDELECIDGSDPYILENLTKNMLELNGDCYIHPCHPQEQ